MDVEVGVDLQESAGLDLVQPAAAEVRIGNQAVDAGELLEERQHLESVHGVEEAADARRDLAQLVVEAELLLARVVESHPAHRFRRRELAQHRVEVGVVEQPIDDDVRKGIGRAVLLAQRCGIAMELHRCHSKFGWRFRSRSNRGEYVVQPSGES